MTGTPKTIDAYLSRLTPDKRATLQAIRRAVKSAAPEAEECISYQMPAFRLHGRVLVWFAAATNHCSFFPGAYPIRALKAQLKAYKTSKGTVRFPVDKPLPAALVRKLVKARIAENAARQPPRARIVRRRSKA